MAIDSIHPNVPGLDPVLANRQIKETIAALAPLNLARNAATAPDSVAADQVAAINTFAGPGSGNPKDQGLYGNNLVQKSGLSDAAMWATPGYISTVAGADGYVYLDPAAVALTLGVDSFAFGVGVNDVAPGADQSFMGFGNANTRAGLYIIRRPSGGIRLAINPIAGGAAFVFCPEATEKFFDGTPHHIGVCCDGPTRSFFQYFDGVVVRSDLNVFQGGGAPTTSGFALGTNQDTGAAGTSVAAKFANFKFHKWMGQGLPHNIHQIMVRMATMGAQPFSA